MADQITTSSADDMCNATASVLEDHNPMTVRQVFYQLVNQGHIAKSEEEYQTVSRVLIEMRRRGKIPFGVIADRDTYHHATPNNQETYAEIWLEKGTLVDVLYKETERWNVPLRVTYGYPSTALLSGAAEVIAAQGKPAFIDYFGDWDPSGLDIARRIEDGLREFAPDKEITFRRVAVTKEQIDLWKLTTHPTKPGVDGHEIDSVDVEIDAIEPQLFTQLVREAITAHIDKDLQ